MKPPLKLLRDEDPARVTDVPLISQMDSSVPHG